ncbi:MAG: T9SS type A sorting domain-containing protein [Saprospiraceae bacterium]|nr:T9SS type A sorting domain-containing protein [Candidatus Defluviibacterium haderslevense]
MSQVQIVDVQGHILYDSKKELSTYVIPTNQWLKGIYFMSTMDDSGRPYYHKVVIE